MMHCVCLHIRVVTTGTGSDLVVKERLMRLEKENELLRKGEAGGVVNEKVLDVSPLY